MHRGLRQEGLFSDVFFYADMKQKFEAIYAGSDTAIQVEQFGGQCTEKEILRCTEL